jgi:hypothetical protein
VWGCKLQSWEQLAEGSGLEVTGRQRGSGVEADRNAFLRLVAERYFSICAAAIKRADPNHMVLGARWAGYVPVPVLKASRDHVDVLSFNTYEWVPPYDLLDTIYRLTGRPIMITEFSFKAMDSGHPNTQGGGRPMATQADRLAGYERYFMGIPALPILRMVASIASSAILRDPAANLITLVLPVHLPSLQAFSTSRSGACSESPAPRSR